MPEWVGTWTYETFSNSRVLAGVRGSFEVQPATASNHGPVGVHNVFHFAYADGTPYYPIGTTCYTWTHRPEAWEEMTLKTLAASPFNKLRMCVFPQEHCIAYMPPTRFSVRGGSSRLGFQTIQP